MTHDRVGYDEFTLTQGFLSQMLGVSPATVAATAKTLQDKGLISFPEEKITVLDRNGLEKTSCECYLKIRDGVEQLLDT